MSDPEVWMHWPRSPIRAASGGAKLPSTVGGLLFHAAEHTLRHAGQALTTAKLTADK